MNKKTEIKEKVTPKEGALLIIGVLLGVVGGIMADYMTMFSKESVLGDPLGGSIIVFIITLFFLFLLYRIARGVDIKIDKWVIIAFLVPLTLIPFLFYHKAKTQSQKVTNVSENGYIDKSKDCSAYCSQ